MIPQSISLGASLIPALFNARELSRKKPVKNNAMASAEVLADALTNRVQQIAPNRPDPAIGIATMEPKGFVDAFKQAGKYANVAQRISNETGDLLGHQITINPNIDRAYLAHEMGHVAGQQTAIGQLASNLRDNPKLSMALGGAMLGVPIAASALEEGDDDLDTSLATAMLAASPTLVDEALASKNALAIMDTADMRASLGQRGKLAGGFLSYVAPALVAGIGGNYIGNQFDSEQTPGELNPQ